MLCGLWSPLSQILDQHHFVAFLAVEYFIGEFSGEQDSESAGPDSELRPQFGVLKRRVIRVGDGRVLQLIEREALAGVANVIDDATSGSHVRETDLLLRIGMPAVLDGIHQQLPKSSADVVSFLSAEVGSQFRKKLSQAFRHVHLAAKL